MFINSPVIRSQGRAGDHVDRTGCNRGLPVAACRLEVHRSLAPGDQIIVAAPLRGGQVGRCNRTLILPRSDASGPAAAAAAVAGPPAATRATMTMAAHVLHAERIFGLI